MVSLDDLGHFGISINIKMTDSKTCEYNMPGLLNKFCKPGASIDSVTYDILGRYDEDNDEFSQLTDGEMNSICYENNEITLVCDASLKGELHGMEAKVLLDQFMNNNDTGISNSTSKGCIEKKFFSEGGFTVRHMLEVIAEFEKLARPYTDWFGGMDLHHVFFEGFCLEGDHRFSLSWGS